jgi:hypothetical protein
MGQQQVERVDLRLLEEVKVRSTLAAAAVIFKR